MVSPKSVYDSLKKNNIDFYAGVPDSLLKYFCAYITDHTDKDNHIITANEGNSIALGIGYYLSTKKLPLTLKITRKEHLSHAHPEHRWLFHLKRV